MNLNPLHVQMLLASAQCESMLNAAGCFHGGQFGGIAGQAACGSVQQTVYFRLGWRIHSHGISCVTYFDMPDCHYQAAKCSGHFRTTFSMAPLCNDIGACCGNLLVNRPRRRAANTNRTNDLSIGSDGDAAANQRDLRHLQQSRLHMQKFQPRQHMLVVLPACTHTAEQPLIMPTMTQLTAQSDIPG